MHVFCCSSQFLEEVLYLSRQALTAAALRVGGHPPAPPTCLQTGMRNLTLRISVCAVNLLICLIFILLLDSYSYFPPLDITGLNILIVPSKQLFQMHQNSFSWSFQINTDSNQYA